MVGTNFPYTKHLPQPGRCGCVQIEADPVRAGNRIPTEVPVIGDAQEALRGAAAAAQRSGPSRFLGRYQQEMDEWRADMAALENADRDPIAPQYLMSRRRPTRPPTTRSSPATRGTIATWAARHWTIRGDRQFYLSGNLATMAPGLPYAIAAQHAYPGRQVIAFVGDGGFAMLMAEFLTAVRHQLPIKVVINNNGALGQILWEQMVLGYPEFGVRHPEPFADFAPWATACGALGRQGHQAGRPAKARSSRRSATRGPALRRLRRQPQRAADAGQGRVRAGQELRARRSCAASRTAPPSRPRCSRTGYSSSAPSRYPRPSHAALLPDAPR